MVHGDESSYGIRLNTVLKNKKLRIRFKKDDSLTYTMYENTSFESTTIGIGSGLRTAKANAINYDLTPDGEMVEAEIPRVFALGMLKYVEYKSGNEWITPKKNKIMRNFLIDGYYKDDKTEFSGYLVSETDDYTDDEIFFYGLSEEDIQAAIKLGDDSDIIDFVITSYEKVLSSEESSM